MSDRLDWFRCHQSKLLGALTAMPSDEQLIYVTVLLRIYEVNGPCPDDARALSLRTHMPTRRVTAALDSLTGGTKPKLTRVDGGLMNGFAQAELDERINVLQRLKEGGKKGGSRRAEKTKEKQSKLLSLTKATLKDSRVDKELELEKEKKESVEANASTPAIAASDELFPIASSPVYTDSRHELWGEGKAILEQLGIAPKKSGPMIGRWLKDAKDDDIAVMNAIRRARDNRVADPIPWITRAISQPTHRRGTGPNGRVTFGDLAMELLQERIDDKPY